MSVGSLTHKWNLGGLSLRWAFVTIAFAVLLVATLMPQTVSAGSPCPTNYFCLYQHINRGGNQINYYMPTAGQCYNLTTPWNDIVSSIEGGIWGLNITVFDTRDCFGTYTTIAGAGYNPDLPWWTDDDVTSFCRGSC